MNRSAKVLILGIAIGAVGAVLSLRIRQVLEERNPDALAERIASDLEQLEKKFGSAEA